MFPPNITETHDRIVWLYNEGYTTQETAHRAGVCQTTVRYSLKRQGVRLRSATEAYAAKKEQHTRWERAYYILRSMETA